MMQPTSYDPLTSEVLVARTLPVSGPDDLTPYHWVRDDDGRLSLRKGPPPVVVKQAAVALADGRASLNDFLDIIGVPKS